MAKFKPADVITPSRDYVDGTGRKRLTQGNPYVLKGNGPANGVYPEGSLILEADDIGVSSYWPLENTRYGDAMQWSLYKPAPFTLLDDEGRKALKAGDRVLVEATVIEPKLDEDGEMRLQTSETTSAYVVPARVFALLPPTKKPAAVGDFVSIATRPGSKGKVLAFTSAGVPVVEFADGDGLTARTFDASVLEVIS